MASQATQEAKRVSLAKAQQNEKVKGVLQREQTEMFHVRETVLLSEEEAQRHGNVADAMWRALQERQAEEKEEAEAHHEKETQEEA